MHHNLFIIIVLKLSTPQHKYCPVYNCNAFSHLHFISKRLCNSPYIIVYVVVLVVSVKIVFRAICKILEEPFWHWNKLTRCPHCFLSFQQVQANLIYYFNWLHLETKNGDISDILTFTIHARVFHVGTKTHFKELVRWDKRKTL